MFDIEKNKNKTECIVNVENIVNEFHLVSLFYFIFLVAKFHLVSH
jgi:hypothetical protein